MSEKGEVKIDFTSVKSENKMFCEIEDGLELILSKEIVSEILLSNEEVYRGYYENKENKIL